MRSKYASRNASWGFVGAAAVAALTVLCACRADVPASASEPAFQLPQRDLIPEGIAFDSRARRFFISSIYHRKIVQRHRDGSVEDFTAPGQDSLGSALGMEVDLRRNLLWVCSYRGARGGSNALFAFDLRTGRLARRLAPPDPAAAHLLNDIELAPDGTIYVTDSFRGAVYVLRPKSDSLQFLVPPGHFRGPNGIALALDRKVLFVSDDLGITAVDLPRGRPIRLTADDDRDVFGIDGLYYHRGQLLAVQNSSPNVKPRVLRAKAKSNPWRVDEIEVLESRPDILDIPTTGTVARNRFYFIASSRLSKLDQKSGRIPEPEKVLPSEIRQLR